jgi:hypothetical protein
VVLEAKNQTPTFVVWIDAGVKEIVVMSVARCRCQVHVSYELFTRRAGKRELNLGNNTIRLKDKQEEIIGSSRVFYLSAVQTLNLQLIKDISISPPRRRGR